MRPYFRTALVASAIFAVAGTAFAQSRGVARVGPAKPTPFWVHDDGTVEVNDATGRSVFRSIEQYLASDVFQRNGRRCGLPAIDDRISRAVIDTLSDGALLFFHYPDGDWSRQRTRTFRTRTARSVPSC